MPVWWYPFSSIRWSPASTKVALVGALGLGRASALACSAMCDLLRRNNRPVDYNCQVVESKYSKCDGLVAYLRLADNSRGPLLSRLRGLSPPVVRSRNGLSAPVCRPPFWLVNTPILLVDRPIPRRWTILCLVH